MVAGRYRLDSHLGSGGMGTVWRGWDERLRRRVAVKEVTIAVGLPEAEEELLRERYLREARAAARLRHPAVVGVYDVISESGRVWIVMELINARDLAAVLREDGPLDPARAARIGLQLLDALDAAHEAGVLHRDVKPANVLIDSADRTVLTDFGVASVTGDSSLTRTGQLVGSPAYLAPERLTGGTVGPASDLWSLGCTLYAAVEGRPPFHRPEQFAIIAAITVEPVPRAKNARLLGPVLYGLLDKDQASRWDTARARAALERVAEGLPVVASAEWGAPPAEATTMAVTGAVDIPSAEARHSSGDGAAAARPVSASPVSAQPVSPAGATQAATPTRSQLHPAAALDPVTPGGPTAPVAVPQEPRRRSRRGALAAGILTTILGASVIGAGAAYVIQQADRNQAGTTPSSPSPSVTAPPVVGTKPYTHPSRGFRLQIPSNWSSRDLDDSPTTRFNILTGADRTLPAKINSTMNLYVYVHPADGQDPLQLAQAEDRKWATHPNFRNYKTLRLAKASMGTHQNGSLLEFTYDHVQNGPRHVLVFRTVVNDISYEVSLNGPADQFAANLGVFDNAVDTLEITAKPSS